MAAVVVNEPSAGRLGRLLARLEHLPDDLRAMFISTIVHGKPKADVCCAARLDGRAFDETYSRMLRELKRDEPARSVAPPAKVAAPKQGIRLRFPVNPHRP